MVPKNVFPGQQWRKTYGHGERGRECEMYGNSNMETYITLYIKEIATRNLLYVSGNSNRGSMST